MACPNNIDAKSRPDGSDKGKNKGNNSLATTKDQVKKMLGEYIHLPIYSLEPEQRVNDAIQELLNQNNWPNNLISLIKNVLGTPCDMPLDPEFSFKLSDEAAMHNLTVLRKYQFNLGKALEANKDSPLGPGIEFKPPNVLHKSFSLHLLWSYMEAILAHGSVWP
jgi:hypothetical protein